MIILLSIIAFLLAAITFRLSRIQKMMKEYLEAQKPQD